MQGDLSEEFPLVSIVLPIHNEVMRIQQTLSALLGQTYSRDRIEILISDGFSTDGTRELINIYKAKYANIRLIDNSCRIVPTGLNSAICASKGELIIRVDGHTEVAPDYIRQCLNAFRTSSADNVGGKMNAIGQNPFGRVVATATSSPFGVGGARFHYSDKEEWVDTVYMGAWRREVFEKIGLFDEELVRDQDDEFNYRLRAHGGKILLSPKIKSKYTVRGDPWSLLKQYFQYGFWKVRVLQKHPRQMRPRQFVPPAFVGSVVASGLLALFHPVGKYLLVFILGLYLLANLAASVWTVARLPFSLSRENGQGACTEPGRSDEGSRWKHLPLLPVVYAILHISYGLGFLIGLVRFIHRWRDRTGKVPPFPTTRSAESN